MKLTLKTLMAISVVLVAAASQAQDMNASNIKEEKLRITTFIPNDGLRLDEVAFPTRHKVDFLGTPIPIIKVEEVISQEAGITVDEFATLLASQIAQHAKTHNVEFCACLCKGDSGTMGAVITTISSRAFCPVVNLCPQGMKRMQNLSIHNHLPKGAYEKTSTDRLLDKLANKPANTRNANIVITGTADDFSEEDMEHDGYMISMISNQLKFHKNGKVRIVSSLTVPRSALVQTAMGSVSAFEPTTNPTR
jgi:hypothetical protein